MASIRIAVPREAAAGEAIELKAIIQHRMESGFRRDSRGEVVPRDILTEFVCLLDGEEMFRADFFPGVAANPFLTFPIVAERSGTLEFRWTDQHGTVFAETRPLTVA
ncbi:MAG: thiosulfate oxidation carrier complex protein SoxZ [Pseudomonadota bacterium]